MAFEKSLGLTRTWPAALQNRKPSQGVSFYVASSACVSCFLVGSSGDNKLVCSPSHFRTTRASRLETIHFGISSSETSVIAGQTYTCRMRDGSRPSTVWTGDHSFGSWIYWGSKEGFSVKRRTLFPSAGPHYSMGANIGNLYDRKPEEDYMSRSMEVPSRHELQELTWDSIPRHAGNTSAAYSRKPRATFNGGVAGAQRRT